MALLVKQQWRFINNPGAFWARLLKSIYFPKSDFRIAAKGARPSWVWAGLF
ncbi:hypothetical protein LINPERPRIM_LOCUS39345 [Linum perenne]